MFSFSRLTLVVAFLAATVSLTALLPVDSFAVQDQEKGIYYEPFRHDPVKITVPRTKKGAIEFNKKFDDDADWFKGLALRVENISNKPINYINVMLLFERPAQEKAAGKLPFGESLIYGSSPFWSRGVTPPAKAIPPGGSVILSLRDEDFDAVKDILKKDGYSEGSVNRIVASVQEVGFEDGTVRSGSELYRSDPDNPGRPIPVPQARLLQPSGKKLSFHPALMLRAGDNGRPASSAANRG